MRKISPGRATCWKGQAAKFCWPTASLAPPARCGSWWIRRRITSPPNGKKLITGLDRPYGLALWKEYLYVGEPESVKRYRYDAKNMTVGKG